MPPSTGRYRILHLVSTLNIGGLEMVVLDLVRRGDRAAFDMRVLCLGETGALAPRFEAIGVPAESLDCGTASTSRTVFRLARRLRTWRPDVLHTHNSRPHLTGSLAACAARVPVLVHTKHGRNRPDLPKKVRLNRFASLLSTRIVPVSEDAADVARRVERVPAAKVHVIRNGIDLDNFVPPTLPKSAFGKRAIHVARLNHIKDQRTLLRAARRVLDAEPDFRLDLVGDGPDRETIEALHRELDLGDRVRLLGFRTDVRELLAAADFFILSSVSEGISLTLLEAMAMGLPIVSTDVGGNREVVADGETGLLVPARSPEALADAVLALIRDPARSLRMGMAGRTRVETEFDLGTTVARYEALYRQLLESPRASARQVAALV